MLITITTTTLIILDTLMIILDLLKIILDILMIILDILMIILDIFMIILDTLMIITLITWLPSSSAPKHQIWQPSIIWPDGDPWRNIGGGTIMMIMDIDIMITTFLISTLEYVTIKSSNKYLQIFQQ